MSDESEKDQPGDLELKYRSLFEQSPDGILLIDQNGKILEFNNKAHEQLGYTREEFSKFCIADLDPVKSPEEILTGIQRTLKTGKADMYVKHSTKQGDVRDVHVISQCLTLGGRTVIHSIWLDVTEEKRAQDMLRKREAELKESQRVAQIGNWDWDAVNDTIWWSDEYYRIYGYDPSKPTPNYLEHLKIYKPESAERLDQAVKRAMKTGEPYRLDLEIAASTNSTRWVLARGEAKRDASGNIRGLRGTAQNITNRKNAESEREVFFKFFNTSNDLMCIAGLDGYFKVNNPTWTTVLGYSEEQLLQKPLIEFIHPDDVEATSKELKKLSAGKDTINFINRYRCKDGSYKWLEWKAKPSNHHFIFAIARDITERKIAEEKLRQSEQFVRNILNTVDEGFIVIGRDYRIHTANKAYCSQVGRDWNDVIGQYCYEVSHNRTRPCHEEGEECQVQNVFAKGDACSVLHKHVDEEGHTVYVEAKGFPIKDDAGNIISVIETINNITEKRLLEEERLKTHKLESIGALAGGIAHDFNNLLQGIFGYISMAKLTIDRRDKALAMLEQAEHALNQSVNLTGQLLTFSKGGKPVKKLIDLRSVIENSTKFTLSGSRSDFRLDIPADLWKTEADEGQIGQVIQNVVLNADQSMPMGGSVMVTVRNVPDDKMQLPAVLPRGNYVAITISDSGIGIPEQYIPKIFDPYFTTKEKGSGLGLATAYSIVKNHGGSIDVKTKSGEGSTFMIYLPALNQANPTRAETGTAGQSAERSARILVMDDEALLRSLSTELLGALGHQVEVAKHGQEALDMYQQALAAGKRFDLVILDLTVKGGMGGTDAMRKLLLMDPSVKAIVSSGYSDDSTIANHESQGFKAYLKKPYNIDSLRNVLSSLLG